MTGDELLRRYADGERDFSDADLSCADLSCAYLGGADLSDADLSCADLSCAYLGGADLSRANFAATRLCESGTWSECPPRVSSGDWHAIVVAPGIVKIGCTVLSTDQWLARAEELCAKNHVDAADAEVLRWWVERIHATTEWPGFEVAP